MRILATSIQVSLRRLSIPYPAMAISEALPSLEELKQKVQSLTADSKSTIATAERAALLTSLHKLAAALESPEDVVSRAIWFVCVPYLS